MKKNWRFSHHTRKIKKGDYIKNRTKKIDEKRKKNKTLESARRDKRTSTVPSIRNNNNNNIQDNIHSRNESKRGSSALPRSVPTEGRISVDTVVFNRQYVNKLESILLPKNMAKYSYNRTTALPIIGGQIENG